MSKKFIQDGKTMDFVTAGAVAADSVIEMVNSIGIALAAATASGQTIPVAMEGVVELPKETGIAFTQGQKVYWDATNDRVDATNTNIPCGLAWRAQASGDAVCWVKLNAGAPA
jgi:predicted RecA/RadA family phage recombinase